MFFPHFFRNQYKTLKTKIRYRQRKREEQMISIKIYKQGSDLLIGACDEKLIGKKFKEGKFQIEVSREFYDGKRIDKETLKRYLEQATIANLVGELTVECAIEIGAVDPDCVIKIKGVPHAQMVKML